MEPKKIELIDSLLQEAARLTGGLEVGKNNQEGHNELDLLSVLFQIQSLVVSIRAERCIEQFIAEDSQTGIKGWPGGKCPDIIQWNRRRREGDRRRLPTYIADDRRTGIADRRKK